MSPQHPDFVFDPATGDDIALLHLAETIPFDDNMQPIQLARPGDDFAGQSGCFITGWGVTCEYTSQLWWVYCDGPDVMFSWTQLRKTTKIGKNLVQKASHLKNHTITGLFVYVTSCEKCHIWPITLQLHETLFITCNQMVMTQIWHFSQEVIHTKSLVSVWFLSVKLLVQDSSLFWWYYVNEFMPMKMSSLVHCSLRYYSLSKQIVSYYFSKFSGWSKNLHKGALNFLRSWGGGGHIRLPSEPKIPIYKVGL